jgi:hypothetical protein
MGVLPRAAGAKIDGAEQMRRPWRWPRMTDFYLILMASGAALLLVSFVLAGLMLL